MTGDCHVPFRGSLGVRFPRATRLIEEKAETLRSVAPVPARSTGWRSEGDVDDAVLRSPRTPLCGDELSHQPNGRSEGLKAKVPPTMAETRPPFATTWGV
jgi:hypothetical protein